MERTIAILLLVISVSSCGVVSRSLLNTRVVGGFPAVAGEFPWMVSLQLNSFFGRYHFCAGSIIDAQTVVTAAHCVHDVNPVGIWVVAGEHRLDEVSGFEQERQAVDTIVHEDFVSKVIANDIAIIKLQTPFELNAKVAPVALPEKGYDAAPGTQVTVTGWGLMEEGGDLPNFLMKGVLPIVSDDECRYIYGDAITGSMQCAGLLKGGSDSCQGDSGGPSMLADGRLVGIVSWGYGCARSGYPGVYTRVSRFLDWISSHTSS